MNILSYNPGHDGAIAYLKDARLRFSIEAEKEQGADFWRFPIRIEGTGHAGEENLCITGPGN